MALIEETLWYNHVFCLILRSNIASSLSMFMYCIVKKILIWSNVPYDFILTSGVIKVLQTRQTFFLHLIWMSGSVCLTHKFSTEEIFCKCNKSQISFFICTKSHSCVYIYVCFDTWCTCKYVEINEKKISYGTVSTGCSWVFIGETLGHASRGPGAVEQSAARVGL